MTKRILIACILVVYFLALFAWNNTLELRAEEPRRAIVAMEMVLSGNYWVPEINAMPYYNKPPVFFWLLSIFFQFFGFFSEWVVRLPSLLSFGLIALLNYGLVRKFLDKENALLSSLLIVSSADLLFYGTVNSGEIDLFFSLLVFLQVSCFFWFYERQQYLLMFVMSYIFVALGTLTKGPPSIAFQAFTVVPWLLWHRRWGLLFGWQHILGGMLFLSLTVGYFYQYNQFDDGLGFAVRLFKEASQRTGFEHNWLDTLIGFISFPFFWLKLLFPFFLWIAFWWRKDFWSHLQMHSWLKFCFIFLLFNLPLYWFSGDHKSRYLYPFVPTFCGLLTYFYLVNKESHSALSRFFVNFFRVLIIIFAIVFLVLPFVPQTAQITGIMWKSCLLFLVSSGILYLYQQKADLQIYTFVLFLGVLRIGMNLIYLPLIDKNLEKTYSEHIEEVLKITGDAPVHWNAALYHFSSDASIGPLKFAEKELTTAPLIAYQIPYYLTKGNGKIMQFDSIRQSGQYYLAPAMWIKKEKPEVLYRFRERWQNFDLVLFKEE